MIQFYLYRKPSAVLTFHSLKKLKEWLNVESPYSRTSQQSTVAAIWKRVTEFNESDTIPVLLFDPFHREVHGRTVVVLTHTQEEAEHRRRERASSLSRSSTSPDHATPGDAEWTARHP